MPEINIRENIMPLPYEPKVKNRFLLTLPELFEIKQWQVRSVEMPSVEIGGEWNPMKIRFSDPIGPSVSQNLWVIYRATIGNKNETIRDFDKYCDLVQNGFDAKIELLDPCGVVVSEWILTGCKILRMDFGALDYKLSEGITCGMTIKPKEAILLY